MFNFTPTLNTLLSGSPITTAIRGAHQMARQHLERGGAASAKARPGPEGFRVPSDIDAAALAAAIQAKLRVSGSTGSERDSGRLDVLQKLNGQLVVPRVVVERLGGGNADRGEQVLERLMREIRSRRVLASSRARQR
jgi:hypothetical protein